MPSQFDVWVVHTNTVVVRQHKQKKNQNCHMTTISFSLYLYVGYKSCRLTVVTLILVVILYGAVNQMYFSAYERKISKKFIHTMGTMDDNGIRFFHIFIVFVFRYHRLSDHLEAFDHYIRFSSVHFVSSSQLWLRKII